MFALSCSFFLSGCQTADSATPSYLQWQSVSINFKGPDTSETANINPFTDYRLWVTFSNGRTQKVVRGFYAADGNAANSGAREGNVWRVRFSPPQPGVWQYEATMYTGNDIALNNDPSAGKTISLKNSSGRFEVKPGSNASSGFFALGQLYTQGRYYKTAGNDSYWLKGGTNSPENLLGFKDFDQTYRITGQDRDGEAQSGTQIHHFSPHRQDWKPGDPTWQDGKGKNIIGMMNYLAQMGMNSAYMLTLNIEGDGKDVWPYTSPTSFNRFDVSKLAQWNILFEHMQSLGIAVHIVIQETENERMLDGGDTGPMRRLYFDELIARFGHLPGLIWNLGEENGPAEFSPDAQTDSQRIAMANYFKHHDPYEHPVIIHTHSTPDLKDKILTPLLGLKALDGLSFQVNHREQVNAEMQKWIKKSESFGKPWAITMDEIGEWMEGAKTDDVDPTHDSLRRHALWGSIMAGGAGVEWYFGAHQAHNDLTAEDLRSRHNLWSQTSIALNFFNTYTRYWAMTPINKQVSNPNVYAYAELGKHYVMYLPAGETTTLTVEDANSYTLFWFDPVNGGALKPHREVLSGKQITLPKAPSNNDWVALISAVSKQ
ncbi:DUF5060 domain-containing protein [Salinimonas profundi]|uniref:DUF5060 domain-containing protein n=1 Tax=Salinimonas profundi TaxID=2729140 RepID=UPI00295E9900|nr:DUF5060 domain-containing protein [Salinimonas profundi]